MCRKERPDQEGGGRGRRQWLTLPHPQVGDAGLYTCLAQSPAGEVEKSFRVRVQGRGARVAAGAGGRVGPAGRGEPGSHAPSAARLGPPHVVGPRGPRSVVGLAPGQLVLECSVEAEPAPEIEWHRDGVLLQVGARRGHPRTPDQTDPRAGGLPCARTPCSRSPLLSSSFLPYSGRGYRGRARSYARAF